MIVTRRSVFIIPFIFTICSIIHPEQLIILTFRPYPIVDEPPAANQFANNLQQPGKKAYNMLRSFLEGGDVVSGIFCTYAGFLSLSDRYGQVLFPKLQTQARFHLLITTRIIPIPLTKNTIHHWEIEQRASSQLFVIERIYDTSTELYVWHVQEVDISSTFANQKEIPLDTIIILSEPKHIFIPTGATIEKGILGPHFILPPFYVRKGIDRIEQDLYLLNLKYFFRTLRNLYKIYPSGFSSLLDHR